MISDVTKHFASCQQWDTTLPHRLSCDLPSHFKAVMPKPTIKFSIHFFKRHGETVLQKCLRALKIQCQHLLFLVTNAYYCVTTEILYITCNHGIPKPFRRVFKVLYKSQFKEHHHYCFFPPPFHLPPLTSGTFCLGAFVWYRYWFYCFFFLPTDVCQRHHHGD